MSSCVIKNANIVLSDRVIPNSSVLISGGKISQVDFRGKAPKDAEVFSADGGYLLAGFIDSHVHGGGNADFMDCTLSAFETVVTTHLRYGTTTLVPTAMSATERDLTSFLLTFKEFKKKSEYASMTPGVHLEGPYFSGATAKSSGAQPRNVLRLPDAEEIDRLLSVGGKDILRWDAAPELEGSDMFAKKMRQNGIICSIAHSAATSEEAQAGIDSGFSHVTHFYNAVTTYHKKDQKVLAGVVEAAYLNPQVTVELICDGLHIHPAVIMGLHRMFGEKLVIISDSLRCAGLSDGHYDLAGQEIVVTDGKATLLDGTIAGSSSNLHEELKNVVSYGMSLESAVYAMTEAPAKAIGEFDSIGSLDIGKAADMLLLDENLEIKAVIIDGEVVIGQI